MIQSQLEKIEAAVFQLKKPLTLSDFYINKETISNVIKVFLLTSTVLFVVLFPYALATNSVTLMFVSMYLACPLMFYGINKSIDW